MDDFSTAPTVSKNIKFKQLKLYDMVYDYLIDNFHKFSEANKIKVAQALAVKMAPAEIKGEGFAHNVGNKVIVYVKEKDGSHIESPAESRGISTEVSLQPK